MSQDSENQSDAKGFAGFDALVSDVAKDLDAAARPEPKQVASAHSGQTASEPKAATQSQAGCGAAPLSVQSPSGASGLSGTKWVFGVAFAIFVLWLIGNSGKSDRPTYEPVPAPTPAAAPEPAPGKSRFDGFLDEPVAAPVPAPAPTPVVPTPSAPSKLSEEKPPVGTDHVLNYAQIRYCLSEKVRIRAMKDMVNPYSENEVDRLNAAVADYNSRCGSFRYRRGSLESVQRDVDTIQMTLEAEGAGRVLGWRGPVADSSNKTEKAAKPNNKSGGKNISQKPIGDGKADLSNSGSPSRETTPFVPMPQNAQLDYTGRNWECQRGYRRADNECRVVQMPANAQIDYTGHNWECQRGYRRVDNECRVVQMPANAQIDYTGHNWECQRGYRRVDNECRVVQMPANAQIDYTGHNWECQRGYRRVDNECRALGYAQ